MSQPATILLDAPDVPQPEWDRPILTPEDRLEIRENYYRVYKPRPRHKMVFPYADTREIEDLNFCSEIHETYSKELHTNAPGILLLPNGEPWYLHPQVIAASEAFRKAVPTYEKSSMSVDNRLPLNYFRLTDCPSLPHFVQNVLQRNSYKIEKKVVRIRLEYPKKRAGRNWDVPDLDGLYEDLARAESNWMCRHLKLRLDATETEIAADINWVEGLFGPVEKNKVEIGGFRFNPAEHGISNWVFSQSHYDSDPNLECKERFNARHAFEQTRRPKNEDDIAGAMPAPLHRENRLYGTNGEPIASLNADGTVTYPANSANVLRYEMQALTKALYERIVPHLVSKDCVDMARVTKYHKDLDAAFLTEALRTLFLQRQTNEKGVPLYFPILIGPGAPWRKAKRRFPLLTRWAGRWVNLRSGTKPSVFRAQRKHYAAQESLWIVDVQDVFVRAADEALWLRSVPRESDNRETFDTLNLSDAPTPEARVDVIVDGIEKLKTLEDISKEELKYWNNIMEKILAGTALSENERKDVERLGTQQDLDELWEQAEEDIRNRGQIQSGVYTLIKQTRRRPYARLLLPSSPKMLRTIKEILAAAEHYEETGSFARVPYSLINFQNDLEDARTKIVKAAKANRRKALQKALNVFAPRLIVR